MTTMTISVKVVALSLTLAQVLKDASHVAIKPSGCSLAPTAKNMGVLHFARIALASSDAIVADIFLSLLMYWQ